MGAQVFQQKLDTEKAPLASPVFTGVPVLPTYTIGTLPSVVEGGMIFVSDAVGGAPGSPLPQTGAMCFGRIYGSPEISEWVDVVTGIAVV